MSLNRAMRRKAEKAGAPKPRSITPTEAKAYIRNEMGKVRADFDRKAGDMITDAVDLMLVATATVLHDKWSFEQADLKLVLEQIEELSDSLAAERVSLEDCRQVLKDEAGIELHRRRT